MSAHLNAQQLSAAEMYLNAVPASFRRRGQECQANGAVKQLTCTKPGRAYQARVQGSFLYQVDLNFDGAEWNANCSCPLQFDCKHGVAALVQLLEINGRSVGGSRPVDKQNLEVALRDKLGRPLSMPELSIVGQLRDLYLHSRQQGAVYANDVRNLTSTRLGAGWEVLLRIQDRAISELRWWGFLAVALQQRGAKLPSFLLSVVDPEKIRAELAVQKRQEQIQQWQLHLDWLRSRPVPTPVAAQRLACRLRVGADRLELHVQDGPNGAWRKPKQGQLRQLAEQYEQGQLTVAEESLPLWLPFFQRWQVMGQWNLEWKDQHTERVLGALLRQPATRALLVDAQDHPLRFAAEPLRWQVLEKANAASDYELRLVQANGENAPPAWWVLEGQPTLYLTEAGVFAGPPQLIPPRTNSWESAVSPKEQAIVPGPVLESAAGLELLHYLGAELPAALQARVQHVRLQVELSATLANDFGQEQVYVTVRAQGGGRVEEYQPHGWAVVHAGNTGAEFNLFDRSALASVPVLMQASDLKWDAHTLEWRWRVTRNFPSRFAAWLASLPPEFALKLDQTLATLRDAPLRGTVRLDVQAAGVDWFDLKVVLDVADTALTKEELKALLDARGGFVRVGQGGWRRLQFDLGPEQDAQLAELGLSAAEFSSEPQRLHALQLAHSAAQKFLPAAQVQEVRRRAGEIQARVSPPVPATLQAQLRPYQLEGFHFLAYLGANRFGGILADDMGLGKTLQTLTWLLWLRDESATAARPSLVVCPKSVTDNWRVEAERFAPPLRVQHWSNTEKRSVADRLDGVDLLVINYAQLRLLADQLTAVGWQAVILDEGQYIKNPESQTAKVACALRAEHRLVLTGTPIENRLMDLWSLLQFAMPGVLGSRARFARQFDKTQDPLARQRLAARVRPFLLRRTKAQVAPELPERIEEDLLCEMEPAQRTIYRAELKKAQQQLLRLRTAQDLDRERFSVLTSLLRLRQICCHPALIDAKTAAVPSAKIEALLELLEPLMEEGHKVLVFSQFVGLIQLLEPLMAERGWKQFVLTGATENRGQLVASFQKTRGGAVFLISLKAGGFGLNLTAASYVVLFDPWWNPAVENQAIDRTHRIGQTRHVNAYRLLIKDTVEEKIRLLQKSKSALAADVLGEERFAQALSLDDLKYLLAESSADESPAPSS